MLFSVWVQDRGVLVEKRAMGALPTALHDLSCCLRPQSKDQIQGGLVCVDSPKCGSLQGVSQGRLHYAEVHRTALDVEVEAASAKQRGARIEARMRAHLRHVHDVRATTLTCV